MKEETRNRKQSKIKVLHELKKEARFNVWILKKMGYSVNIESVSDGKSFKEMDWSEIYSFENFWIYENRRCILCGCNYSDLRNFTKLAKRYKHLYGVKRLHNCTDEIVAKMRKAC